MVKFFAVLCNEMGKNFEIFCTTRSFTDYLTAVFKRVVESDVKDILSFTKRQTFKFNELHFR